MIIERAGKSSVWKFTLTGMIIGIGVMAAMTLAYYQSGNDRFCGSCHSMKTVHTRWGASNHRQFGCTECHLPDTHIAGKVVYKTRAGLNDLVHEAARAYQPNIGLSAGGRNILNGNCVRCHESVIGQTQMVQAGVDCLKCHRYLVHGRGQDEGGISIEK